MINFKLLTNSFILLFTVFSISQKVNAQTPNWDSKSGTSGQFAIGVQNGQLVFGDMTVASSSCESASWVANVGLMGGTGNFPETNTSAKTEASCKAWCNLDPATKACELSEGNSCIKYTQIPSYRIVDARDKALYCDSAVGSTNWACANYKIPDNLMSNVRLIWPATRTTVTYGGQSPGLGCNSGFVGTPTATCSNSGADWSTSGSCSPDESVTSCYVGFTKQGVDGHILMPGESHSVSIIEKDYGTSSCTAYNGATCTTDSSGTYPKYTCSEPVTICNADETEYKDYLICTAYHGSTGCRVVTDTGNFHWKKFSDTAPGNCSHLSDNTGNCTFSSGVPIVNPETGGGIAPGVYKDCTDANYNEVATCKQNDAGIDCIGSRHRCVNETYCGKDKTSPPPPTCGRKNDPCSNDSDCCLGNCQEGIGKCYESE